MRQLILWLCVAGFFAYNSPVNAQNGLFVAGGGGYGAGWWIHHLGPPGLDNKGLLVMHREATARLGWQFGKSAVGLVGGVTKYDGYYLREHTDRVGDRERIVIGTNKRIRVSRLGVFHRFNWVEKRRFRFSHGLAIGIWKEDSVHPDKDRFDLHYWYEWDFRLSWKMGRQMHIGLGPQLVYYGITMKPERAPGEKQSLSRMGLSAELSWYLFPKK